jgi:AAA domain
MPISGDVKEVTRVMDVQVGEQVNEFNPGLLTANGVYDTNKDNGQPYPTITLDDIRTRLSTPTDCIKEEAPFTIFSTYREYDGRDHAVQREKGQYFALPGDIDTGNPALEEVDAALMAVYGDVERLIYSTSSASECVRKWRYLIPLASPVPGADYPDIQKAAFDMMSEQGITCDRALERTGQPVFLPNVPNEKRNPQTGKPLWYRNKAADGPRFNLKGSRVLKRVNENRQAEEEARQDALKSARRRAEKRHYKNNGAESPIDAYNRENDIDSLLIKFGYEKNGDSPNWRSPYQESGSYATKVEGDYWVSLSGSDAEAGIGRGTRNGHRGGDAFDLFCHYEHEGDVKAAIRALDETVYLAVFRPENVKFNPEIPAGLFGEGKGNDKAKGEDDFQSQLILQVTTMTMEAIQQQPTPREMICHYFPVGATSAIVAMGGVGKTTWKIRNALEALKDDGELEVMIVSSEDSPEDYQAKIHNALYSTTPEGGRYIDAAPGDIAGRFHVMNLKGTGAKLVAEQGGSFVPSPFCRELALTLKEHYPRVRLVIFETVSRFAGGEDNERMEALVTACDRVALNINGASVCVHHTGKAQAREKIIDLYSGRGGSALGDNTRSMIVMTRLDKDYPGEIPVLVDPADVEAGRAFEVKHVRNSYGPVLGFEYYVTRSGYCNGPVLEPLPEATEEDATKARLAVIDAERKGAATQIYNIVKEKKSVPRKFFDTRTRKLIGVTQADGRAIIAEMIASGSLVEVERKEGRATLKMLEIRQGTDGVWE